MQNKKILPSEGYLQNVEKPFSSGGYDLADEYKERILIVDDEEVVLNMFVQCLSERYACITARSFLEALALLKLNEFALVITDVIMPGLSGIELLRKIIEKHPSTAVIIVSGVDRRQRVLDAVKLGAFDYLIKPCDLEVLELTVDRAIQKRISMCCAR